MEGRVSGEAVGVGPYAHQLPKSIDGVVHDDGTEGGEGARVGEHIEQSLIGFPHPVRAGTERYPIDGESRLA